MDQKKNQETCIPWRTWRTLLREHGGQVQQEEQQRKPGPGVSSFPVTPLATTKQPHPPQPPTNPSSTSTSTKHSPSPHPLPPGTILDENGKPCKICNSWQTWAKIAKKERGQQSDGAAVGTGKGKSGAAAGGKGMVSVFGAALGTASATAPSATPTTTTITSEPTTTTNEPTRPPTCPPDVAELGRATWTFLHTTASYYPPTATPVQQTKMRAFIDALGEFYPCSHCAEDFRRKVAEAGGVRREDVQGREGLERWFCERHNEVNRRLGKGVFDCKMVGERWRDGPRGGECD